MKTQLDIAKELGLDEMGLPISSDPVESLFGVVKTLGASKIKDANRIATRIPAMCGQVTEEDARRVLEVSVRQQQKATDGFHSLLKQSGRFCQIPVASMISYSSRPIEGLS